MLIWTVEYSPERRPEYAAAFDASIGETDRRYTDVSRRELASNETGYHVYRADIGGSEVVLVVWDGQDQETIGAVERDCEYLTAAFRCDQGMG